MYSSKSPSTYKKIVKKCKVCNKLIKTYSYLHCVVCKEYYDLDCARVPSCRFYSMTRENKTSWRCIPCLTTKSNQNMTNSTSTPISRQRSNDYVSSPTNRTTNQLGLNCSIDNNKHSHENITHRNKIVVNVSTENSFSSLSDDENLDRTSRTINELNRSCPKLNSHLQIDMDELQEKVKRLQVSLDSSENEVSNLLHENLILQKKVEDYELEIKKLKLICKTTTNDTKTESFRKINKQWCSRSLSGSMMKDKKISKISNLTIGNLESKLNIEPSNTINKENSFHGRSTDVATTQMCKGSSDSDPDTCTSVNNKGRILIIGDERLSGLSVKLTKTRSGKWNDNYKTFGFIQPNATSTQFLEYCNKIGNSLSKNDIVILGIGGHDNNPQILHTNLCLILNILKNAKNVFLIPVCSNLYLNENMLNYHFKLWINIYNNCTFIDMSNRISNSYLFNLFDICRNINLLIDSTEYDRQFLSIKGLAKHKNTKPLNKKKSLLIYNQPVKGTIPYYFPVVLKPKVSSGHMPQNNSPKCFRP